MSYSRALGYTVPLSTGVTSTSTSSPLVSSTGLVSRTQQQVSAGRTTVAPPTSGQRASAMVATPGGSQDVPGAEDVLYTPPEPPKDMPVSSGGFPWKVVLIGGGVVALGTVGYLIWRARKKKALAANRRRR